MVLGLVLFRLGWGLVGSTHARFAELFPTPTRSRAALRGEWKGVGSITSIIDVNASLAASAGLGHWNDPDMLEVGNDSLS